MGERPAIAGGGRKPMSRARYYAAAVVIGAGVTVGATGAGASAAPATVKPASVAAGSFSYVPSSLTPIQHVVVIFDENVSFDHYFGTYPYAANTDGSTFHAKPGTPTVNGLYTTITASGPAGPLLTSNRREDG